MHPNLLTLLMTSGKVTIHLHFIGVKMVRLTYDVALLQANYSVELWFHVLIKKSMFTGAWLEKMQSFSKAHERSQAWNLKKEKTKKE